MEAKNLHFFDKSGYELNFEWVDITNSSGKDFGYWQGNIYLPKVSLGLYANTSIYVLEEVTDENGNKSFVFPKKDNEHSAIRFNWDILNKFVDEFFMFTFDSTYITTETSALEYSVEDGPTLRKKDILLQTRFDTYEVNLETVNVNKALPIHVAFTSPVKYNATTFKRTLVMESGFRQIARITFFAETVEEDERLKALCSNFGYNITPSDEVIFKKSNIKEPKTDYQLLNEKRKELMINGHEIYPYIGSYKALINALKFFGYDNLNVIDLWQNVNEDSENYLKIYYVKKYTLTKSEVVYTNDHNITLPSNDYRKSPNIALSYYINRPKKNDEGDYEYDVFELPYTKEEFNYTIEDAVIKLFALRDKLNKDFLPGSSRIIDIIGESSYYGLCEFNHHFTLGSTSTINVGKDLSFSAYPNTEIRITSDKLLNEYIYDKLINGWNTTYKNLSSIIGNIKSNNLGEITLTESNLEEHGSGIINFIANKLKEDSDATNNDYSQLKLCEYYKDFYKALNVKHTIKDDIVDDLNDYYAKNYNYTSTYMHTEEDDSDSDDDAEISIITKNENSISEDENNDLISVVINSKLKKIPDKAFYNNDTLETVTIKYGITEIGKWAFRHCTKLTTVTIPNTVKKINYLSFGYCRNLTQIKFAGTEEEWNEIEKNNNWNSYSPNIKINCDENLKITSYDGYNLSAKVVLTNNSLPEKTFGEMEYTFGNIPEYYHFNDISYKEYTNIEWSITYSDNQVDEDLENINVVKNYGKQTFSETKGGLLSEYNSCYFELPYVGYYDVKLSLIDNFNNVSSKILTKYIKVQPYNIDIRGFYYDIRSIPDSLLSDYLYKDILFNDYDDSDSDSDDIDEDELYYIEMKSFIKERIQSMIQIAVPESAPFTDENSMPVYRTKYDCLNCIAYLDSNNDVTKLYEIGDDGEPKLEPIFEGSRYNPEKDTPSEITYKKFYNADESAYRIYTKVIFPEDFEYDNIGKSFTEKTSDVVFNIENVTYKYIKFDTKNNKYTEGRDKNPFIKKEYTPKCNGTEFVNQGPYFIDNIFNEWYLTDNVSVGMSSLVPSMKYIRYIRNGVDVKPYTWFLIGYEYSLIRGKCNPRWTLINTTKNKRYPNLKYADSDMTDEEKELLPTHKGKYFTYLLKDEGNYKVILELDDVNGNHYSVERNLFVVSNDANYKLYTPFLNDYKIYTDAENEVYNDETDYIFNPDIDDESDSTFDSDSSDESASSDSDASDIEKSIGEITSNNEIKLDTTNLPSGEYTISFADSKGNELTSWMDITKFTK